MGLVAADFHFNPAKVAAVDLSSTDYTPAAGLRVHGVSFAGAGDLKVDTLGSTGVTITSGALAAGVQHALEISKIYKIGTTATGIFVYGD
jgi:hypothetical protein